MKRRTAPIYRILIISALLLPNVLLAASGDLDPTFGTGGMVLTETGYDDRISAMALQPDGKIIVVGYRNDPGIKGLVARYNADGSLDSSFGLGGIGLYTAHGGAPTGHDTYLNAVAVQADGKIIAAGYFVENGGCPGNRGWLIRLNPNGSVDTTFNVNGMVELYFSDSGCPPTIIYGMTLQGDGKIVLAGSSVRTGSGSPNLEFGVARLNTDGSTDTLFSGNGKLTTLPFFFAQNGAANAVTVNSTNGKILIGGYVRGTSSTTSNNFALIMLNPDGSFDGTFGYLPSGVVSTDFFEKADSVTGVAFQPDGKILASGTATNNYVGTSFALARYNANGSLDTAFNGTGKVTTSFGLTNLSTGMALRPDNRVILAGSATISSSSNFALAAFNTNGSLYTTFSGDGKQTTDFPPFYPSPASPDYGRAIVIQPDGKILVAGHSAPYGGSAYDIALARYEP